MAFSPDRRVYGAAALNVDQATGSRIYTATHSGGTTYPNAHVDGVAFTINFVASSSGVTPPSNTTVGIAIVEDNTDVAGNYTNAAGSSLSSSVLAYAELGLLPATQTVTIGLGVGVNAQVQKGGTYRIVLTAGNTAINARNASSVNTGAGSTDYHFDSDGNSVKGGLSIQTSSNRDIGGCGHRVVLTARSGFTGNKRYRDTIALALSLRPANATSAALINPKEIKAGHRTSNADGTAVKLVRGTPNTTGDVTLNFPVDTDFGQVIGGTDYFTHVGVNNTLGDTTTPANETAGIWSTGTIVGVTTAQRAAFVFSSTGHVSGMGQADSNRLVSTTADTKISAAIQLFKDAARTIAGVGAYATSAYALAQNIFKRIGAVNLTNAVPYLEAYIADAYGAAMASLTNAFSAATQRMSDSVAVNTQTLSTDANGRVRWNYTISATDAAFSRFVKSGTARQTGSHVATGPDNPASPPATFSLGNGDRTAPFPGYGRKVVMTGTGFSAGKEPSDTENNVFGVNSELTPDDLWTGPLTAAQLDVNGVPTGAGSREQTLGAGSLKTKWASLIDEGSVTVIDLTDSCVKDVAGRDIDLAGAESVFLRRAIFNDTLDTVDDGGTNLSDAQTSLDTNTQFGYHSGNNSMDTIAAPADGASFRYWLAGADVSAQRTAFAVTLSGSEPVAGFTADSGNFGYFEQSVAFAAADLSIGLSVTPTAVQTDPTLSVRFGAKVFRITPDNQFVSLVPDTAPVYAVWGVDAAGAQTIIAQGSALAGPTSTDFYFDVTMPLGYEAVNVTAFAKVNGSRTPGGGEASVQIGYKFDAVGTFVGLQFK